MRSERGARGSRTPKPAPIHAIPSSPLKVAFATPELLSLSRRTNLAEIAEYLPRTLVRLGVDVEVFLPFTRDVEVDRLSELDDLGSVHYSDELGDLSVDLHRGQLGELNVILVDHPELFRARHPYGDENGPYPDNWRRYAVFARAVLGGLALAKFKPDVLHCLDWTTGLIPVYHQLEIQGTTGHPRQPGRHVLRRAQPGDAGLLRARDPAEDRDPPSPTSARPRDVEHGRQGQLPQGRRGVRDDRRNPVAQTQATRIQELDGGNGTRGDLQAAARKSSSVCSTASTTSSLGSERPTRLLATNYF